MAQLLSSSTLKKTAMTQSLCKESLRHITAMKPMYFIPPENTRDTYKLKKGQLEFIDLASFFI